MLSEVWGNWYSHDQTQAYSLESLRVLVVDDNDDSLELVRIILEEYGTQVLTALSARQAFEAFLQFKPDVLISDIAMPGEDGYSLIRRIRALSPQQGGLIPAIALTACVVAEERLRSLTSGFQVYLPKPLDPGELVATVANLAEETLRKRLVS
jgi:CheY-like chemotaxis protein